MKPKVCLFVLIQCHVLYTFILYEVWLSSLQEMWLQNLKSTCPTCLCFSTISSLMCLWPCFQTFKRVVFTHGAYISILSWPNWTPHFWLIFQYYWFLPVFKLMTWTTKTPCIQCWLACPFVMSMWVGVHGLV